MDTRTAFTDYCSASSCISLILFCVFFRVLRIHLTPSGPSLLTPAPAWQYPHSRPFCSFELCLFYASLCAFGSLARGLALFLTVSAFPYRDPASVSVFRKRPYFSFLFPQSWRGELSPEASEPHYEVWGRSIGFPFRVFE